jgi:hypothetical protein
MAKPSGQVQFLRPWPSFNCAIRFSGQTVLGALGRMTMRLVFPNLTRPKKSAKTIAQKLGLALSLAQSAVARICGYDDWHDLETNHAKGAFFALDQHLDQQAYIARQVSLVLDLATKAGVPEGDAQYAIADSRLTGDRQVLLSEQIELRLSCWRQGVLAPAAKRSRGAVGTLKSPGRNGEIVILRSYGRPTTVITQRNIGHVADFEFISPRNPPPLFLPIRLYLPYGHWIETDGAKVLFSRDYKPMWRIRDGFHPERLDPSLWINWRNQAHYWDEANTPWNSMELRQRMEALLTSFSIQTLPIWADVLPIAASNDKLDVYSDALDPLMASRGSKKEVAA